MEQYKKPLQYIIDTFRQNSAKRGRYNLGPLLFAYEISVDQDTSKLILITFFKCIWSIFLIASGPFFVLCFIAVQYRRWALFFKGMVIFTDIFVSVQLNQYK